MPKVSVIVPVYNAEKYINRCAQSLFEQTLDDVEYIFVNDCTPDNSMLVLQDTLKKYPMKKECVKFINLEVNSGPSVSRNAGLTSATGQYVIFCDSDDYVDINAYESLYNEAIIHDADIVACGIEVNATSGESWSLLFGQSELSWDDILDDFNKVEGGIYSSMCNKLIKRDFLIKHNIRFDENTTMWEDLYTTIRARYFTKKMYIIDIPYYHYCLHLGSIIHYNIEAKVKSQIRVVKLIEEFFSAHHCEEKCIQMISFLKFLSKESLLNYDMKKWISIFPEANKHIYTLRKYFGRRKTLKYLLLGYGRELGCAILNVTKSLKNHLK